MITLVEKRCCKCKTVQPIDNFHKNKSMCKSCARIECREYHRKHRQDKAWAERERTRKRLFMRRSIDSKTREELLAIWRARRRKKPVYGYEDRAKWRARFAVKMAVKNGKIEKPEKCPKCGDTKSRIDAHHDDYSKPLDIVWLCSTCHGVEHRRLKDMRCNLKMEEEA